MSQQPAFRLAADSPYAPAPVDPALAAKLADEREHQERLDDTDRWQEPVTYAF